jgi:hypothetical protein
MNVGVVKMVPSVPTAPAGVRDTMDFLTDQTRQNVAARWTRMLRTRQAVRASVLDAAWQSIAR